MQQLKLTEECIHCLVDKFAREYPKDIDEITKLEYIRRVLAIISGARVEMSAPEIVEGINSLQREMFGGCRDYTKDKKYFNALMLSMEKDIRDKISSSDNMVKTAVKYSMMGNYIDFGTMDKVDEGELMNLLYKAEEIDIDEKEFASFSRELASARRIVLLTDNCGEILLDKLLIWALKEEYPKLKADAIVRGYPVLNDATIADASEVGLEEVSEVTDNGSRVAGTCLNKISAEAHARINRADIIISKGQGNFETLRYCGKNVYYIFMCKCRMFAEKFGVPLYSGMFLNDLRL